MEKKDFTEVQGNGVGSLLVPVLELVELQDKLDQCYIKIVSLTKILKEEPDGPALWQGVSLSNEIEQDLNSVRGRLKEIRREPDRKPGKEDK